MVMGMIEKGQCNYPGAWGNVDTAAQAIGTTADAMTTAETNIKAIVKTWYNNFYAGTVDAESYAQMQADVNAAGYEQLLAFKWELLLAAMPAKATK